MPNARHANRFASTTDPQRMNDQKMLTASSRMLDRTVRAVASCSSVLNSPRLILCLRLECAWIRASSHAIMVCDLLLNRSEERRVGKECRARWMLGRLKKKYNQIMINSLNSSVILNFIHILLILKMCYSRH